MANEIGTSKGGLEINAFIEGIIEEITSLRRQSLETKIVM